MKIRVATEGRDGSPSRPNKTVAPAVRPYLSAREDARPTKTAVLVLVY